MHTNVVLVVDAFRRGSNFLPSSSGKSSMTRTKDFQGAGKIAKALRINIDAHHCIAINISESMETQLVWLKSIVLVQLNGVAPRKRDGLDCVIRQACVPDIVQCVISHLFWVSRGVESCSPVSAVAASESCDCTSLGCVKLSQGNLGNLIWCLHSRCLNSASAALASWSAVIFTEVIWDVLATPPAFYMVCWIQPVVLWSLSIGVVANWESWSFVVIVIIKRAAEVARIVYRCVCLRCD